MTDAASLPYLDEHSVLVAASREPTWSALLGMVEEIGPSWFARTLGAIPSASSGPRPLVVGSAVPGFRVAAAAEGHALALAGRHRYSRYVLTFRLHRSSANATRLTAVSHADFPGWRGAAYRGMVVGTRLHVLATRRMLGDVKRHAERSWNR